MTKISSIIGIAVCAVTLLASPVLAGAGQANTETPQAQMQVLLAQSMADRMRQAGDAVANSPMLQKAMNTVQAELTKCMKAAIADDAVLSGVMGGDYRAAAVDVMRVCIDRVESGEFAK